MRQYLILLPILIPILGGMLVNILHMDNPKRREPYVAAVIILNSIVIFGLLMSGIRDTVTLIRLGSHISIAFRIDGMSMVFGGLLAGLWPLAVIYAFEYMEHEHRQTFFFSYYTMTFGVAVGVAFSANLITMYLFYEILTFITLPIIMHEMDDKAVHAGRKYIIYSITGASFALMGILILLYYAGTTDLTFGGILSVEAARGHETILRIGYLLTFFGFGVKAAVFPFHGWLPTAGVAPTPVTALLHAVAVVKAGVFAIIRVTYYGFGTALLSGTWTQYVVMSFAAFTIIFGSSMALREHHFKRRLAYSTVSNLSYIIFGITIMTPEGMAAGLSHMIFHGVMKITLFFCAGAVLCKTHREYIDDLKGFGRKMPVTFFCFTIGSLALTGVPGLCGFISKYNLIMAATNTEFHFAYIGILALIISAVLTAIYQFQVVSLAYIPGGNFDYGKLEDVREVGNKIKIPLLILCALMLILGLNSVPLMSLFNQVAQGLM